MHSCKEVSARQFLRKYLYDNSSGSACDSERRMRRTYHE